MLARRVSRPRSTYNRKVSLLVPLLFFALWLQCATLARAGASASSSSSTPPSPARGQDDEGRANGELKLEAGAVVGRELAGGEAHAFEFTVPKGRYVKFVVEQRGIDVVARLKPKSGEVDAVFDGELRSEGEERVELAAVEAGVYLLRIEAASKNAPAGRYDLRVGEVRDATESDLRMHEARLLKAEHERAFTDGRYDDARRFAERALEIGESAAGAEHPFVASLLIALAAYYDEKQDVAKTLSLLERARAISEKALGEEHPQSVEIARKLAWAYLQSNEVAKAERLAQRAVDASERVLGPEHRFVAKCLFTLSQIVPDLQRAEQLLRRSLAVAEKTLGEEHAFVGDVLNQLGVIHMDRREYQQAEPHLLRSQAIYRKTQGAQSISHVYSLHNLGRIARERKDYAKAEEYYGKAIEIVERAFGPENPRLAIILNNVANIFRARGDYAKSLEAHLRVLRISEATKGPTHPLTLMSLGNIARTHAARGEVREAVRFQKRVDAVIERNIEINIAIGSERQKLSYLNSVAERTDRTVSLNLHLAPGDPDAAELAALVLLQRKGRVLDAMSESFAALRQRATPEERALLERYNDTTGQLARMVLNGPQGVSFEDHQAKAAELEEEKERLEEAINRRNAEFRARTQPVTLASVRDSIPAEAALIEFVVYRPFDPKAESNNEAYGATRYAAYVVRREGVARGVDLGEAKDIDAAVAELRQALRDPSRRDARELSRSVDEKLMRPLRALAGDARHLIVSPDGALNLIPFEALLDERGQYLVQRYSFTYLTSGRDLARMRVKRGSRSGPLVVADPSFGDLAAEPFVASRATNGSNASGDVRRRSVTVARSLSDVYFAPLSGTAREAVTIRALFPEARLLTGARASEPEVKNAASPRILHVATHGFFLEDGASSAGAKAENPLLRSGLALAGANLRGVKDDGILTAMEATGLNLWGTKLVVLSACDTGLGEVKNGEGVYGLRRAFTLAGAESVLMSLWPVSDQSTRRLMTEYYRNLKRGQGRGASLRQVQLDLLGRNPRLHPFYWANFIQSGDWTELDETTRREPGFKRSRTGRTSPHP